MGIHADNYSFAKLGGFAVSTAGLGMWKFLNQPQLGGAVFAAGAAATLWAGYQEVARTSEDVRHRLEEGRPVTLIGRVDDDK